MSEPGWDNTKSSVAASPPGSTAELTQTNPLKCTWAGCENRPPFKSLPALRMHTVRAHTHRWSTSDNFKNATRKRGKRIILKTKAAEERRRKYRETVKRYHAAGLNAHGEPFAKNAMSDAMKKSWARRKGQLNGAAETPAPEPTPTDTMGEAARAVIVAAKVLRSVSLGLKL